MKFKNSKVFKLLGSLLIGGLLGFAYYYFVGCKNSCPIQSNLYASIIYGGIIGGLISFTSKKKNDSKF